MSTRSTVSVHASGRLVASLYRHCDGYPECNGAALCRELARLLRRQTRFNPEGIAPSDWACYFLGDLIRLSYEKQDYEKQPKPIYELTASADRHSDREWHYSIDFTADGAVRVDVFEYDTNGYATRVGRGSLADFRAYVAGRKLAERRRRNNYRAERQAAKRRPIAPAPAPLARPGRPAIPKPQVFILPAAAIVAESKRQAAQPQAAPPRPMAPQVDPWGSPAL